MAKLSSYRELLCDALADAEEVGRMLHGLIGSLERTSR
jgi:hypothetical protein